MIPEYLTGWNLSGEEMTALERIKEIEREYASLDESTVFTEVGEEHAYFLLKAFRVMREIAIAEHGFNWQSETRAESAEIIDEEFEERMRGLK